MFFEIIFFFFEYNGINKYDCIFWQKIQGFIVYHREPILLKDKNIDQRIKSTLGITG